MTVIMRSDKIVRPERGRTTLRPSISVFGRTRSTGSDTSLVGLAQTMASQRRKPLLFQHFD